MPPSIVDMLDDLPKEVRDAIVEKYYVDYKNLPKPVKKLKEAFEVLTEEEKDIFMRCLPDRKKMVEVETEME